MTGSRVRFATALLVPTLAAGCDWRAFDDLADQTWVDTAGAADGMTSDHFGFKVMVAGSGGSGKGARFFTLGDLPASLGRYTYSPSGSLTAHSATAVDAVSGAQAFGPSTPVATDPGTGDEGAGSLAVAITDSVAKPWIVIYPEGMTANQNSKIEFPLDAIAAMAFGGLTVPGLTMAGETDLVVAGRGDGEDRLAVLPNHSAPAPIGYCTHGWGRVFGVHVAELMASSEGAELIVATGSELRVVSGAGLHPDQDPAVTCDSLMVGGGDTLAGPSGADDFGAQIVSADFNGAGGTDIAVSAPGSNVVVAYLDWNADGPTKTVELPGPGGSVSFGAALAAGDLDGAGGQELVVGDPGATAGGKSGAGVVHIYSLNDGDSAFEERREAISDAEPIGNHAFGRSVATARFGTGRDVLVVGALDDIFTYFRLLGEQDVRN